MGTDIIFDLVSGKVLNGADSLKKMTLFANGSAFCELRYHYDLSGNRTAKAGSRLMAGEANLHRTAIDWAEEIKYLVDVMYPDVEKK